METMTTDQLRKYAVICIQCSSLLKEIAQTTTISSSSAFERLMTASEFFLVESTNLISSAIDLAVADAQNAADRIIASTNRALDAVKTINQIEKILNIVTAVLNLFTAITTGIASGSGIITIGGALKSLEDLLDTI
jgi:hypothetical protein